MKPDDDDTSRSTNEAFPSANAIVQLEALAKKKADKQRAAKVWRIVAGASANPDVHVVLDFAREHELVLPCEQTDPNGVG